MTVHDRKKLIWNELVLCPGKPKAITPKILKMCQIALSNDTDFWSDILFRHGLLEKDLYELDAAVKEHVIGNFWGMVCQKAAELGVKI